MPRSRARRPGTRARLWAAPSTAPVLRSTKYHVVLSSTIISYTISYMIMYMYVYMMLCVYVCM